MIECPYCTQVFDDDGQRHDHLFAEHDVFTLAAEGRVEELVAMRMDREVA